MKPTFTTRQMDLYKSFFISRGSGFNIFGPHGLMKRESSEIKFRLYLRKSNSLFRVRRKEIDKIIQSSEVIK